MRSWGFLLSFAFLALACSPQNEKEIQIQPVSPDEARSIRESLLRGDLADDLTDTVVTTPSNCPVPSIQGLNVQGSIEVPENYDAPEGRKIHVFYYGRLEKNKEPVVFFNGGPASDSHGSARILDTVPMSQDLSFIYIDQRGTGCSDSFPSEPTAETVERLSHYTSTEIVKDAEAVRVKLLGAEGKWKVFGQSYGGLIVHRYSLVSPTTISGAYAHGFSLMENQNDWLTLRIKSQKRVSEIYFASYPQDRKDLEKIRSLIAEDLCFNDEGTKVCGPKIMDALTIFLGFTTSWSSMHQMIDMILSDDGTLQMDVLKKYVRNYVFGVYNNNGLAGSVISIVEISGGDSDADSCNYALQKLKNEGENPESWLLNECRLLAGMKNDKWVDLLKNVTARKAMTPAMLKQSLQAHPELPFYLYSGQKDVFVPYETFAEEVAALGSLITYRQFANSGHEGFYTEARVWADLTTTH